jgi:L-lactate permease
VSTAVSALPVVTLFFVLVALKRRVWVSALSGLMLAVGLALWVFQMPAVLVATAAAHGFIFGMMRIAWIVVASIFLYNIASTTGQFQVMKDSIADLSSDKRLQLVLIAFCFGAFLEGTGGGGAPVAIAGSFLIGLGFNPFQAATLCLLANTAPVAWGGVGNPIRVLGGVTGLPEAQFSAMAGRILPPLSLILPIWLVRSMVGWRETWQVLPALLVSGASFAAMQFYWSNYQDIGLVDIVSAIFSLLVTVTFLKFWKPSEVIPVSGELVSATRGHGPMDVLKGWSPFIVASVLIFITGLPAVARYLNFDVLRAPMPFLHNAVLRMPPVAPMPTPEDAHGQPELPQHPRHGHLCCRRRRRVARGVAAAKNDASVRRHGRADDAVAAGDQLHGRLGVCDALLRYGHHPGSELDRHGIALSVLRYVARLVGRGIDGHRCGVECVVRQSAKSHSGATALESHPDGSGQHDRRRDGQDDRCTIHRRIQFGNGSTGQRSGHFQSRLLAQRRPGISGRRHRHVLRLRDAVGYSMRGAA